MTRWEDEHPTAYRLKGYIEDVLGYPMAKRWRKPGFNCATWKTTSNTCSSTHERSTSRNRTHRCAVKRSLASCGCCVRWTAWGFACLDATIQSGSRDEQSRLAHAGLKST